MPSVPLDLPDVNVWIALTDRGHPHHARAQEYWDTESADRIAFCRTTMLGLLRIVTNPKAMAGAPLTPDQAWSAYRTYRALPEVVFVGDPSDLEVRFGAWSDQPAFPVSEWTDCYLAAVALGNGARLVSFDKKFGRYPGLDHLILVP